MIPGSQVTEKTYPNEAVVEFEGQLFKLSFRQHATQGRMSGFASQNCRSLDPIPVLQLVPLDEANYRPVDYTTLVIYCQLCDTDCHLIPTPSPDERTPRKMAGYNVASCSTLKDENRQYGMFFVFSDVGISAAGVFRLRMELFDIKYSVYGRPTRPICTIYSNPINIYTSQKFPGMKRSTPLMLALAKQGIRIPQRYEHNQDGDSSSKQQ
ncbi:velvet factor [Gorgonomyces haynaldii]|nr:velvet factor [Gorgonomyces haynaldii]